MTNQDSQTYLQLQQLISESLSRIAIALEHMIPPRRLLTISLLLINLRLLIGHLLGRW